MLELYYQRIAPIRKNNKNEHMRMYLESTSKTNPNTDPKCSYTDLKKIIKLTDSYIKQTRSINVSI